MKLGALPLRSGLFLQGPGVAGGRGAHTDPDWLADRMMEWAGGPAGPNSTTPHHPQHLDEPTADRARNPLNPSPPTDVQYETSVLCSTFI